MTDTTTAPAKTLSVADTLRVAGDLFDAYPLLEANRGNVGRGGIHVYFYGSGSRQRIRALAKQIGGKWSEQYGGGSYYTSRDEYRATVEVREVQIRVSCSLEYLDGRAKFEVEPVLEGIVETEATE